jgi:hypothetical protein
MPSDLIRGWEPVRVKENASKERSVFKAKHAFRVKENAPKKIKTFSPSTADLKSLHGKRRIRSGTSDR